MLAQPDSERLRHHAQQAHQNGDGQAHASGNGEGHQDWSEAQSTDGAGAERAASRFSILGALTISNGHESVALHPSKPATLLAALLLRPNDVVSVASLQRAIWGDRPPANARTMLHTCVLRLRRLLADFDVVANANAIETVPGGYRFPASADTLDLVRFRDLVRAASGAEAPTEELRLLVEASRLWRGVPLANVRSDTLERDEIPRLTEEWLQVTERRFAIELTLGGHRQVLPELRVVSAAHPGDERFRQQLIEALYRAGRKADALAEYRTLKSYLRDELGLQPGRLLQDLELTILRGEDLRPIHPAETGSLDLIGCQLPPDLPSFAGRRHQVDALTTQLTSDRSGPALVVISGPPGIGKTTLAVHVAHLVRDSFPDGQWAVRLSTYDGEPQSSELIAGDLARQLGLAAPPGGDGGTDAVAALQRAMTDRRVLLLLDDAVNAHQVIPLLPATGGSAVIITSNRSLVGLAAGRGGWVHRLPAFDVADSCAMLEAIVGRDRAAAEPLALREISNLCGNYPVAIRIAATRLQNRPRQTLSDCAERLRSLPLHTLSLGTDPRMSLSRTLGRYLSRLDMRLAQAFTTIASCPDEEFSAPACARLLDLTGARAAELLDELVDVNVLEENTPGHYSTHTVLRSVALQPSTP
jgi:DNA-binding SARP family transcriptional activator/DNA polymerase III delta prime subunit